MKLRNKIGGLMKLEIASVWANLLPMVILWGLAGAAVAAYYLFPMELQITVSGFICAIWALLAIFVGRKV